MMVCTVAASVVILVAGFFLARSGDAIAKQTGLGPSFIGFVLGGIATSLPELSSTISAVRLRQYEMAFADAFGTNLFSAMLIFFADLAYPGQPVLNETGRFSLFATLLGIALTAIYLAGIVVRPKHSILRMGLDSMLVLVIAVTGFLVLFQLR